MLTGGNVAAAVVRVGDTVRKPWTRATPSVHAFLGHVAGLPFVPRVLGRDASGRQILEYVPGTSADALPPMTLEELGRLGRMVRSLHDASAGFVPPAGAVWDVAIPPDGADLVCHQDLAPWNLIRDGGAATQPGLTVGSAATQPGLTVGGVERWTFIDWDAAAPGTRLWDLAYAAQTFAPLVGGGDPAVDGPRLRAVVDGYDLGGEDRRRLPAVLTARTRAMYDLLERGSRSGAVPWARLWDEGHGVHWGAAADYVEAHGPVWRRWLS